MAGGEIDDAPTPKHTADATRHLPRFVQLLAREAAGVTHRACEAIEERTAGKPLQITIGEAPFR